MKKKLNLYKISKRDEQKTKGGKICSCYCWGIEELKAELYQGSRFGFHP
jgi:hypothetical protein